MTSDEYCNGDGIPQQRQGKGNVPVFRQCMLSAFGRWRTMCDTQEAMSIKTRVLFQIRTDRV